MFEGTVGALTRYCLCQCLRLPAALLKVLTGVQVMHGEVLQGFAWHREG